jgi:pantoate--beta-alanine ligase
MIIFKKISDIQAHLALQTKKIGFVPTLGALHKGHMSLINKAKEDGALVVCSIFVNPTQFNDKADFEKYPITTDTDITMLVEAGCDILFLPSVDEIYPGGSENVKSYAFGYLDTILEGAKRPGHFKGVGQVVSRLLDIVQPNYLYLGQKDYQQCMVLNKLTQLMGITNKTQVIICPTVREEDGLAMSSRNSRLTETQRQIAVHIYQCLISIQSKQTTDSFQTVQKECIDLLSEKGFVPEYVSLADASDLTLLDEYDSSLPMVALIAAKLGDVRLIDNMRLN